ncbi:MAG: GNAT family N-acetyltransferase [Anaerolineae bacterium]|nr:GNAT family N-acetyltransferase [Anaerolineae bacterium]
MNIQPITLEGRIVRLEPLALHHAEDLAQVAAPEIFTAYTYAPEYTPDGLRKLIEFHLNSDRIAFAKILRETNQAVGVTTYLEINHQFRHLEIGHTWIGKAYQGTQVNPESKYLLLRHAFEFLGTIRVQFKTAGTNFRSQRAIEKLGAKKEGVLRKHRILYTGEIDDSILYSILDDEWPAVKAGLETRLGYRP